MDPVHIEAVENLTIVYRAVWDDSVFYKKILPTQEACARFAAMKTHAGRKRRGGDA